MRFLSIFTFVILTSFSWSQAPPSQNNGALDGQVFDSLTKKTLEYVSIRVCKSTDTSVIGGIYTDENGKFVLENLPYGTFIIRLSQSGYNDKFIPNIQLSAVKPLRKLGNIGLSTDAEELGEVNVIGKQDVLQIGLDKKIYNVGEDISVSGGSVNDVLNNIPSIEIDQDGKLSLRGDGNVTILIDGRPSSLSGGNGKSQLDAIPAGSIERIEIVTNPSAKYDPDGTSGIINIVLKKNIRRGVNGSISLTGATGDAYNGSLSLNTRNTKYNLYGNYAYDYKDGYRNNFSDLVQDYGNDSIITLNQKRLGNDKNESHTAKVGMDIYLKDRNTLGFSVAGNSGLRTRTGDQTNFRHLSETDTLGYWNRTSSDPGKNKNIDLNLNYNWEFKADKGTLDAAVYQSIGNGENQGYYGQSYTFPSDTITLDQRLFSTETNNINTASLDLVRIIGKWRTESGLKAIHRQMGVDTHSDSRGATGEYQEDTLAFYDYSYTERIYSGYGILARAFNKVKIQAGVRAEQSYQEPNLKSKNESYSNDYFNLFPSAYIRYSPFKKGEFSLGYSKRINRPSADNLNPFTSYADPYNLRRGNPALRPEYIQSFELSFEYPGKKISVTTSVYQRFTTSVIQRAKVFYADGTSAGTFINIDKSQNTGGEIVLQIRPTTFWRNTVSVNANYIKYTDDTPQLDYNREGFMWGLKVTSSVELWKKTLTLQVNARYSAPNVSPQGTALPRGSVDFSSEKTLKGGKWGIGIRVSDIFNTQGFRFSVEQPSISQQSEFKWLTRRLYLTVRYKFGRTDNTERKRGGEQQQGGGFDF